MKNGEVIQQVKTLNGLDTAGLTGVSLSYALIHNGKLLLEEAKKIEESLKYPQSFTDMREENLKIFKEHAKKDKKGELIIEDNKYILDPEKTEEYNKIIELKIAESKQIIEEAKEVEEEYEKFLNEEATLPGKLVLVPLDKLPENITPIQMNALSFMITELSA